MDIGEELSRNIVTNRKNIESAMFNFRHLLMLDCLLEPLCASRDLSSSHFFISLCVIIDLLHSKTNTISLSFLVNRSGRFSSSSW